MGGGLRSSPEAFLHAAVLGASRLGRILIKLTIRVTLLIVLG